MPSGKRGFANITEPTAANFLQTATSVGYKPLQAECRSEQGIAVHGDKVDTGISPAGSGIALITSRRPWRQQQAIRSNWPSPNPRSFYTSKVPERSRPFGRPSATSAPSSRQPNAGTSFTTTATQPSSYESPMLQLARPLQHSPRPPQGWPIGIAVTFRLSPSGSERRQFSEAAHVSGAATRSRHRATQMPRKLGHWQKVARLGQLPRAHTPIRPSTSLPCARRR